MSMHRASIMVALALAVSVPRPSLAAEPAGEAAKGEATAVDLGEHGLRRFQAGRWSEALELFRRANAAVHAPTLVLYMARCHARLGDLATAYRLYRTVTREQLAADAPLQFRTAQGMAAQELRWIEPRLAPIKVVVTGVPEGRARLLVDGVEVPAAELEDLAVLAGDHVFEASLPGTAPVRRTLAAVAGHAARVDLPFDPAAVRAPAPEAEAAPRPPPPPRDAPSLALPAVATLGAGGAALLIGTITGAVSLHLADDVKSRCLPQGHCLASDQDQAASAGRLADASTAMFVLGTLAAATGVTLAVLHTRGRARVHVDAGLGGGAVRGVF